MSAPITTETRQDFSAPRVRPNQRNAFGGVWRLTFRRWLSLNQLLATAGLLALLAGLAKEFAPPTKASSSMSSS